MHNCHYILFSKLFSLYLKQLHTMYHGEWTEPHDAAQDDPWDRKGSEIWQDERCLLAFNVINSKWQVLTKLTNQGENVRSYIALLCRWLVIQIWYFLYILSSTLCFNISFILALTLSIESHILANSLHDCYCDVMVFPDIIQI